MSVTKDLQAFVLGYFEDNRIELREIVNAVIENQKRYYQDLDRVEVLRALDAILSKRDVLQAISVAINLDELAEQGLLLGPLQELVSNDYPFYGVDEGIAMLIGMENGPIALSNFGFQDVVKSGVAKRLDEEQKKTGRVRTHIDDVVSALVSSTAAKVSHTRENIEENA